jgi:uncharacterized protein YciW
MARTRTLTLRHAPPIAPDPIALIAGWRRTIPAELQAAGEACAAEARSILHERRGRETLSLPERLLAASRTAMLNGHRQLTGYYRAQLAEIAPDRLGSPGRSAAILRTVDYLVEGASGPQGLTGAPDPGGFALPDLVVLGRIVALVGFQASLLAELGLVSGLQDT